MPRGLTGGRVATPGLGVPGAGISSDGAAAVKAVANWAALSNRSAGTLASAFSRAASTCGGTVSLMILIRVGFSPMTLAMIACTFDPVNGGSPASSSYSTLASE